MASICREILVPVSVEELWNALRDLGALHTRLLPGFVTDTRLEHDARIVTFQSGQVVRELIVDVNDQNRRLAWAIVDAPFRHYHACPQVISESNGWCRFVWMVDLLPNELPDHVARMMESGLDAVRATFRGSQR